MRNDDKWTKRTNKMLIHKKTNIMKENKKRSTPFMSRKMKQLIFAVCSSLIIGTIFGLITLQMSKQEDQHHATILNSSTFDEHEEKTVKQIESFHVYVVQGGVFSEEENAKQWGSKFENLQFPALKWKRGSEYFLLAGIAGSLESANNLAEEMDKQGLDVFVKEWEINELNKGLSEADYNWLLLFTKQWQKSLQSLENGTGLLEEEWINITKQSTELSDQLKGFNQIISHHLQDIKTEEVSEAKAQYFLLQLLYDYEQLVN